MTETTSIHHYDAWSQVPPNVFLTRTQLATLDLPRRPGPLRARVEGYDYRGKKTTIDLYRISESTPSPATARELAGRRGGTPDAHLCTDCGAHPDLPVTVYEDGARLCRTCAHIRRLRADQADAANRRTHIAQTAASLLAGDLAVIHCDLTDRGLTPSGVPRTPSAVRLVALDAGGRPLIDITVRVVGSRARGIPDGAVSPDDAAEPLREVLADRHIVHWRWEGFAVLTDALRAAGHKDVVPDRSAHRHDLGEMAVWWRAGLDPRTGHVTPPVSPGRADRILYLLQQIAADATPADTEAQQ